MSIARLALCWRHVISLVVVAILSAGSVRAQEIPDGQSLPIPAGKLLTSDDFSDRSSGWDVNAHSGGRSEYDNGEYVVVAESHGVGVRFGSRSEVARDFVVEVDSRLPGGQEVESVYLGVRLNPAGSGVPGGYVRLAVTPARARAVLGLNTWDGSRWGFTGLAEVNDHPAIRPGSATNRLGMTVRGSSFVAYVNGQEVLTAESGTYTNGGLALGVIGRQGSRTEARFDNLVVSELTGE